MGAGALYTEESRPSSMLRTSENSVKAKFAEFLFHVVG
jgi:hypothetical protein